MSNPKKELQLIVFDLDGTLIDSAGDIIRTTHRFLSEQGRELIPAELIKNAIGEGLKSLLFNLDHSLASKTDAETALMRFYQIYEEELCQTTSLYPKVQESLLALDKPFALLTNKGERHARMTLERLGLDRLPWLDIVGGDTLTTKKPDPEGLSRIIKQAGATAETTLMVGDGLPDMRVSKKLGTWSLACLYGYTRKHLLEAEKPHFFVESSENLSFAISAVDDLVRNGYKGPL